MHLLSALGCYSTHPPKVDYEYLRYKGQFRLQLGDDCANVRDGLPGLDVATSRVDVQTAAGLLDDLSPVNV